jgi:hypothetical protein
LIDINGKGELRPCLQHSGMGRSSIETRLYSLERNALETLDREYFYPAEYIDDPLGTG